MAQSGFTPISIYYSATASNVPTAANLVPGELAINTADGKLYYEDSSGVVQVLATKSTGSIGGSNTQVQFNNSGSLGGSSSFTWDGTTVTATKFAGALNGTVGATTASTGAFTTLSTSSTTTLSGLTASTALALDASKNVVSVTNTGTGNNVLSASPTLTGTIAGASLSLSSLTSGRVTYATTSGLLTDSATLTYNGTTLTATTGANFCTTSGNVGIGTSSPTTKLTVVGGGTFTGSAATATNGIALGGTTTNWNRVYISNTGGDAYIGVDNSTGGGIGSLPYAAVFGTTTGTTALQLVTAGTAKLTILTGGNVGIGTSSPTAKLEVVGVEAIRAVNDAVYISFYNSANTTRSGYLQMQSSGASTLSVDVAQPLTFQTTGTERMRIDSSGVVGIGITTAGSNAGVFSQLQIGGTSTANSRTILYGQKNASAGGIISNGYYDASNNLVYSQTYGVSQLYLNNGTFVFSNAASGTAGTNVTVTERMRIDSSGIVTMSAYGAGAATFSAAGVISSVSDETWKVKDGVPTNTDAMLQKLEPGYWFYNEEKAPTFGEERQLGFYAQNVHDAIGEEAAPTPKEGKPWGYHDRSVLAIAVMSLKNALNTIEELKQRIETMENK